MTVFGQFGLNFETIFGKFGLNFLDYFRVV